MGKIRDFIKILVSALFLEVVLIFAATFVLISIGLGIFDFVFLPHEVPEPKPFIIYSTRPYLFPPTNRKS